MELALSDVLAVHVPRPSLANQVQELAVVMARHAVTLRAVRLFLRARTVALVPTKHRHGVHPRLNRRLSREHVVAQEHGLRQLGFPLV